MCYARSSQESFGKSTAKIKSCWPFGNRTKASSLSVVERREAKPSIQRMMTGLRIRALTSSPIVQASRNRAHPKGGDGRAASGLRDPYEWKCAVTVALVLLRCFARSCACTHTGSEEVSSRDQHQNPQSGGRSQKLHEIASPPPKISRSRSASFICRLGTARQVLRLLNILVQGYTSPKQARRRRKSWPITHWKSRRPCAMRSNRT